MEQLEKRHVELGIKVNKDSASIAHQMGFLYAYNKAIEKGKSGYIFDYATKTMKSAWVYTATIDDTVILGTVVVVTVATIATNFIFTLNKPFL